MLDVNTVSRHPTHFLRGVELVLRGRDKFGVPSENWPSPIEDRFGSPNEMYYAEIWVDGMDWQPSYWIIEEKKLEKPQIQPFIIFKSNESRNKFNDHDFSDLIKAALWYRRDLFWVKQDDLSYFTDMVWPFLHVINTYNKAKYSNMSKVYFEHASQQRVYFLMNLDFIPKYVLERKPHENNRSGGNQASKFKGSISES